jgi:hypothetical protein
MLRFYDTIPAVKASERLKSDVIGLTRFARLRRFRFSGLNEMRGNDILGKQLSIEQTILDRFKNMLGLDGITAVEIDSRCSVSALSSPQIAAPRGPARLPG